MYLAQQGLWYMQNSLGVPLSVYERRSLHSMRKQQVCRLLSDTLYNIFFRVLWA